MWIWKLIVMLIDRGNQLITLKIMKNLRSNKSMMKGIFHLLSKDRRRKKGKNFATRDTGKKTMSLGKSVLLSPSKENHQQFRISNRTPFPLLLSNKSRSCR